MDAYSQSRQKKQKPTQHPNPLPSRRPIRPIQAPMCFKHTRKSRSTSTSVALCLPPFISCSSSEMMFAFALNEIPKQANFPNESNLSFSSSARPSPHNAAAFVSTNDGRQGLRTPCFLTRFRSAAWLFSVSFLISIGVMVAIRHRPLFLKGESESESTACTGTAVHDPGFCWSLLRQHFDPAVVFSIYCRPLAPVHDPGLVRCFFTITSILPSFSRFMVESSSGYSD